MFPKSEFWHVCVFSQLSETSSGIAVITLRENYFVMPLCAVKAKKGLHEVATLFVVQAPLNEWCSIFKCVQWACTSARKYI